MTAEQLHRLIALCYEATSGPTSWSRFATALTQTLSATGCAAVIRVTGGSDETVLWSHGLAPNGSDRWLPQTTDLRTHAKGVEAVTTRNGQFLVGALCARGDVRQLFVVVRSEAEPPFEVAETSLMRELLPHLARAMQLYRTIRSSKDMHEALTEILDRLPEAIFLVDRNGLVLSCNSAARAIARRDDGLALIDDRLCLAQPAENATLRALIAEAVGAPSGGPPHPDQPVGGVATMSVSRPSGSQPLPIVVTPIHCRGSVEGGRSAAAAVITKDAEHGVSVLAPDLAIAFNLTPGEARLAALIADGLGLQDSAAALGITRNTARTHMKRIYAKVGVHSQADLVRVLSRGSIELRLADLDD